MHAHMLPFILMVGVVVLAGSAVFVYTQTQETQKAVSTIDYLRFEQSFHNKVEEIKAKNRGAREEVTFSLPNEVSTLCFANPKEEVDLSSYPELYTQVQGSFENVYFLPSNYGSFEVDNLSVAKNPLCVATSNGRVSVTLENVGVDVKVHANDYLNPACSTLSYFKENNIDLVFLGYNYENVSEIREDANFFLDVLFSVEPFKSNVHKFNAYVREASFDSCSFSGNIKCDMTKMQISASKCPNDYIFLLAKRGKLTDDLVPIQSSAIGNVAKINTADDPLVFVHEFGHSFAGLADEYTNDAQYAGYDVSIEDVPNCDVSPCSWEGACIPGCTVSRYFRPSENSLMNNFRIDSGRAFNSVSLIHVESLLEEYE